MIEIKRIYRTAGLTFVIENDRVFYCDDSARWKHNPCNDILFKYNNLSLIAIKQINLKKSVRKTIKEINDERYK